MCPNMNLSEAVERLSKNVLSNESIHFSAVTLACAKIAELPKIDFLENSTSCEPLCAVLYFCDLAIH
jgi:hypothetical protein